MKIFKTIIMASMMCVLLEGCQCGPVAFGTVTPTSYRPVSYAGDDSDTTFTFDFEIVSTSDIRVWERTDSTGAQVLQTETTHYSVSATNNDFTEGGTVTMVTAPATGITLVIGRGIPYDQLANFIDAGVISFAEITNALDHMVLKIQQLEEMFNRAGLNPETDLTTLDMRYPTSVDRANKVAGWNSAGEWTILSSGIDPDDVTVSAYSQTYLDDTSEAVFKATTNIEAGTDFHGYTANGNTILVDAGVLSIAGLTTAADKMPYTTASDTYAVTALTAFGRSVIDDADADAARATLGVDGFTDRGDPAAHDFQVGDLTTDGTWKDLDLSSIVNDSEVEAVVIYVQIADGAASSRMQFRKNGNTNTIARSAVGTQVANITNDTTFVVPCDSSQVIEYMGSNLTFTTINITVVGWFQ